MCMHTVQYSVQPSKGKYTIRVYYARIVHNPQKKYILYVHSIRAKHTYIIYMHTPSPHPPPPTPGGGNKIIYKLTALQYYIISNLI